MAGGGRSGRGLGGGKSGIGRMGKMEAQFNWNLVLGIGQVLLFALGGLCAKYLSDARGVIAKALEKHDAQILAAGIRIDDVGRELGQFKIDAQKDFVSREDHIRVTQGLDVKLDRLLNEIHKVDKNVTRIAAAQGLDHE